MITIPPQLVSLQPAVSHAFAQAAAEVLAFSDRDLLLRCREQLLATQQRRVLHIPNDAGPFETSVLRLAEQFAVNVGGIAPDTIAELTDARGPSAVNALVNALYILDMGLRLEQVVPVVLAHVDGGAPAPVRVTSPVAPADEASEARIATIIADFAAAAVLADEVDAVTGEMVRLRCAQIHHCRLCGSLRQRRALEQGFDESLAERVSRYEQGGLDESVVAALQLADALIMLPADADAGLQSVLRAHFSDAQIAELCFDVVKWSQQKALVATHIDAPPWEGIHVLDFDAAGHPLFQGPVPGRA